MKKIFVLFFAFLVVKLPIFSQTTWVSSNPGGGGAFTSVGASSTGSIFVGSDLSGAYRSQNSGSTWLPLGYSRGLTATHVSSVAFRSSSYKIVLLGTDSGIFRSTNKGSTFTQVLNSGYVDALKMSSASVNIGYAAYQTNWNSSNCSVYKTTNSGVTWSQKSTNLPDGVHMLKFVLHPTNSDVLWGISGEGRFASGPKNLYKSTNGGGIWTNFSPTFNGRVMDFAIDSGNPHTLYITTYEENGQAPGAFWRSTDNGTTWTKLASNRSGVIWTSNTDPSRLRLIDVRAPFTWAPNEEGVWESNNGINWTKISSVSDWESGWSTIFWVWNPSYQGIVKTIGFDISDPNKCFWQTGQFVFGWDETQKKFQTLCSTSSDGKWAGRKIDNVVMECFEVSSANPNLIFSGYWDLGLWRSTNKGLTWENCNTASYTGGWQGFGGYTFNVVADPTNENTVWCTQVGDRGDPVFFLKSTNSGAPGSWLQSGIGLPSSGSIYGLSIDPNSPSGNRKLFITVDGDVYRSVNDGQNFMKVFDGNSCRRTAVDKFNGNVVYAGGEGGVWRSINGGNSWSKVSIPEMEGQLINDPYNYGWEGVFEITTDPNTTGNLFVAVFGVGKGLWKSSNQGTTWTKILNDDFLRSVAIKPGNSQNLFAGSSSAYWSGGFSPNSKGVQHSLDGGITWIQQNEDLSWPFGFQIKFDPANPNLVWLNNQGNGLHRRNFQTSSQENRVNLDSIIISEVCFYPNPFVQFVTWDFVLNEDSDVELLVFNQKGALCFNQKKVNCQAGPMQFVWDSAGMPNGAYFFEIKEKKGSLFSGKLVKE